MYLLYLDGSGNPAFSDATKHYVLAGVCLHEGAWHGFEKRITALKGRYSLDGELFELHAKGFNTRIKEQDDIPGFADLSRPQRRQRVRALRADKAATKGGNRRRHYRDTAPYDHLTRNERYELLRETLQLLGDHRNLTLFAVAVDKAYEKSTGGDPLETAFLQVVSRFDKFLRRMNAKHKRPERGLLILDKEAKATETSLAERIKEYRARGHKWGEKVEFVLECPFFVNSEQANGLQAADVCAYAIRQYLKKPSGDQAESVQERNFRILLDKFDKANGKSHGVRHVTAPGACECLICEVKTQSGIFRRRGS